MMEWSARHKYLYGLSGVTIGALMADVLRDGLTWSAVLPPVVFAALMTLIYGAIRRRLNRLP
jgi:hypothetical protein